MRLLVISWNYPPRRGGMESLLSSLCRELERKHSVFVITAHAPPRKPQEKSVFRPPWPGLWMFFIYAVFKGAFLLRRDPGITVVLGGSAMVTPVVLFLARLFRRRAAIQVHGLDLIYRDRLYQFLCVRWLRYCDRIIANSRYTASVAEAKGGAPAAVSVIPPGVDSECFMSSEPPEVIKKSFGLEGRKIVLFVGRLARRKGVKEFVERSLPKIVSEVPEVCLVIVGENPTQSLIHHDDVMSELRALVGHMKLEDHVRLLGWLSNGDLTKVYQTCDLVVLPVLPMKEDIEGFGIVLLEAAAAGKPVVATRVGGIPDAIEDGKSGILVRPGDYGSMSRAIVQMLQDGQARSRMGEYAMARAVQDFSWKTIISRYEALFESLRAQEYG